MGVEPFPRTLSTDNRISINPHEFGAYPLFLGCKYSDTHIIW